MLLIIPYSQISRLRKIPFITFSVVLLCVVVFVLQAINKHHLEKDIVQFCQSIHVPIANTKINPMNKLPADQYLCELMIKRLEQRPELSTVEVIKEYFWFDDHSAEQINQIVGFIDQQYQQYLENNIQYLNKKLMYFPLSPDVTAMFTSVFAHGDVWHMLGNIIFLLAFAPALEVFLGRSFIFILAIALAIVTTSMSYSLGAVLGGDSLPALGLSGVVMAMIGLYAALLPREKIRLFVWILTLMRTYYIPAWILAAWYIGFDILELVLDFGMPGINLVAHISGAITGFIFGLVIKKFQMAQSVSS